MNTGTNIKSQRHSVQEKQNEVTKLHKCNISGTSSETVSHLCGTEGKKLQRVVLILVYYF